jgi:hypothetical protein
MKNFKKYLKQDFIAGFQVTLDYYYSCFMLKTPKFKIDKSDQNSFKELECFLIQIREFYYEIMRYLASFGMTRHVSGTRGKKWRFANKCY